MPGTRSSVKNEKEYEALKKKGMSKQRAARIANSPGASSRGGKASGKGSDSHPGWHHRSEAGGREEGRAGLSSKVVSGWLMMATSSSLRPG